MHLLLVCLFMIRGSSHRYPYDAFRVIGIRFVCETTTIAVVIICVIGVINIRVMSVRLSTERVFVAIFRHSGGTVVTRTPCSLVTGVREFRTNHSRIWCRFFYIKTKSKFRLSSSNLAFIRINDVLRYRVRYTNISCSYPLFEIFVFIEETRKQWRVLKEECSEGYMENRVENEVYR